MNEQRILSYIGVIALIVGVFCPLVSLPIVGQQNYFQNGNGDGVFLLGLALISFIIILVNRYEWLFLTSTISIVLLGVTYWHFKSFISDSKADMAKDLADNPFAGIAEAMMQSVQIQWGFAVLFVGAIALMASSIMSLKDIERGNYKILIKQSYKALSIDDDINKLKPKHLMIVQNSLFIIFVISGLWVAQDNIISCILFILSGALCLSEVREHLSRIGLNTPTKTLFLIIPIVLVSLVLI